MDEQTKRELSEIIREASLEAGREVSRQHQCRLSDREVSVVHGLSRAMDENEAGDGTLFIIVQIGKNIQDLSKRLGYWIIVALAIFILRITLSRVPFTGLLRAFK